MRSLLVVGNNSENNEDTELVQSIHAKTDKESESIKDNIEYCISNYEKSQTNMTTSSQAQDTHLSLILIV